MEAAGLLLDELVDMREESGRIVVEPRHAARRNIEALLAGVTDGNHHEPILMGEPMRQGISS